MNQVQYEQYVLRVFSRYINRHRKLAIEASPGWGLADSVFMDELQEIRDTLIKKKVVGHD